MIGIAGFGAFSCLLSSLAQNIVGLYIYPNKLKEVPTQLQGRLTTCMIRKRQGA